ncbi:MAG: 16S rRNA processing protein RimM [Ignavibacteriaceae bacterium]|nr:16S rRNA processing protein RimM [Ignavibacteriaceae bacterium]
MIEYFLIAKIISLEGDKGFLRITPYTDDPDRFKLLKNVFIDFWGEKKIFSLQTVVYKKGNIFLKFNGFDDRESTEIFIDKNIYVDEQNLIKLPNGHYFVHDIIGCIVLRNGLEFGIVVDVYSLASNDIFVIKKNDNAEILIPAVQQFIESIDIVNKTLVLKPGEDFYEEDEN